MLIYLQYLHPQGGEAHGHHPTQNRSSRRNHHPCRAKEGGQEAFLLCARQGAGVSAQARGDRRPTPRRAPRGLPRSSRLPLAILTTPIRRRPRVAFRLFMGFFCFYITFIVPHHRLQLLRKFYKAYKIRII